MPAKRIIFLAIRLASRSQAVPELLPASHASRGAICIEIRTKDRLHVGNLGNLQHAAHFVFQHIQTKMAGRHGKSKCVEFLLKSNGIAINPSISLHAAIAEITQHCKCSLQRLEIAGAVKLIGISVHVRILRTRSKIVLVFSAKAIHADQSRLRSVNSHPMRPYAGGSKGSVVLCSSKASPPYG